MEKHQNEMEVAAKVSPVSYFLSRLRSKIVHLFEPEEVEVTFHHEGKKTTYTYTKVHHKQVA